jgi:bifunctional non-homologous end joining protein LigD
MAAFVISDLPWLDGAGLLAEPLRTRRVRLAALALDRPHLVVLPPATDEGARVLAAAVARGLAAVVAKRLDSPYLPGVTSRLWRSVRIEAQGRSSVDRPDVEVLGDTRLALLQPLPLGGRG